MGVGFAVGVLGVLILSHAAYSTIQYRSLLKITEEQFSGPPISVVMELIAGLVLCMWAALTVPGKFLSILPQSDENQKETSSVNGLVVRGTFPFQSMCVYLSQENQRCIRVVALPANLDFMIFNHRGKALPLSIDAKLK